MLITAKKANDFVASLGVRLKRTSPWNQPRNIFLEVTNRCNIGCLHCGRTYWDDYKKSDFIGDMTLDLVKKMAPYLSRATLVTATGFGEPFLNPEFMSIVRYLKSKNATVGIISNGTLLTEDVARELIDLDVDLITFSIDSPDPKTFAQIRIGAQLEPILENIARLTRLRKQGRFKKPEVDLEIVTMKQNFLQLPDFADMAHGLDIDKIVVQKLIDDASPAYKTFKAKSELAQLDKDEAMPAWREFLEKTKQYGIPIYSCLGDSVEDLFEAPHKELGPDHRPRTNLEFLGLIDGPRPYATVHGTTPVFGWAVGREPLREVEIRLEGQGRSVSRVAALDIERPDVFDSIPAEYKATKFCGFALDLDVSDFSAGAYDLTLKSHNGAADVSREIYSRQVYVKRGEDRRMYCTQPWSTMFVTWRGQVRTCCFSQYPLGDLDREGAESIWHGKEYIDFRRSIVEGKVLNHCEICVASGFPHHYIRPVRSWLPLRKRS